MKSNPVEDELDAIRLELYEQIKDMTSEEQVEFLNQMAEEGMARHGITLRYAEIPAAQQRAQP
jgi:hypothetical protein